MRGDGIQPQDRWVMGVASPSSQKTQSLHLQVHMKPHISAERKQTNKTPRKTFRRDNPTRFSQ